MFIMVNILHWSLKLQNVFGIIPTYAKLLKLLIVNIVAGAYLTIRMCRRNFLQKIAKIAKKDRTHASGL